MGCKCERPALVSRIFVKRAHGRQPLAIMTKLLSLSVSLGLILLSGPLAAQETTEESGRSERIDRLRQLKPPMVTTTEDLQQEIEELRGQLAEQQDSLQTLLDIFIEQLGAEEEDLAPQMMEQIKADLARLEIELLGSQQDLAGQREALSLLVEATLEQMDAPEVSGSGAVGQALAGLSGDLEMSAVFPQTPGLNHFDTRLTLGGAFALGRGVDLDLILALEHGQVAEEGDGTLSLERCRADVPLTDSLDLRLGRTEVPLGERSARNDPTKYRGVLPPATETVILPAIWTTDGLGLVGQASDVLSYQLLLGSALDGSGFSAEEGIRGGRMLGAAGLANPAAMGRIEFLALDGGTRMGFGVYEGYGRNGEGGINTPTKVRVRMYALDLEVRGETMDWKVVGAFGDLNHIQSTGTDVGYWLGGYYVEGAWHALNGLTQDAGGVDLDLFVRYEDHDTQLHSSPLLSGDERDALDRETWTLGASLWTAEDVVFKMDYTLGNSSAGDIPDVLALGMGWSF